MAAPMAEDGVPPAEGSGPPAIEELPQASTEVGTTPDANAETPPAPNEVERTLDIIRTYKEKGTAAYMAENWGAASQKWKIAAMNCNAACLGGSKGPEGDMATSMAAKTLKTPKANEEQMKEVNQIALSLKLNLSQVSLKQERWQDACSYAKEVLATEPENVKALFRFGKGALGKGDFDTAKEAFEKVQAVDPKQGKKELQQVNAALRRHREAEKKAMAGMFS